ncbi:hypothetical protein AA0113_g2490 [Alternaria arborescens]|uniref:Uncharacterized protein n=1 Tax=Alternaria arborescens TaxID=156630 RepID=A0A4Q4SL95_9PLEO|nr:hypothetical protein AA0113_g2490 [Alternaria arborescens]
MAAGGLILLRFYNEASTAPTILDFSARKYFMTLLSGLSLAFHSE